MSKDNSANNNADNSDINQNDISSEPVFEDSSDLTDKNDDSKEESCTDTNWASACMLCVLYRVLRRPNWRSVSESYRATPRWVRDRVCPAASSPALTTRRRPNAPPCGPGCIFHRHAVGQHRGVRDSVQAGAEAAAGDVRRAWREGGDCQSCELEH